MHVIIQGKQISVGPSLTRHAEERLHDINQKYFNRAIDAHVIFSREGHGFIKAHLSTRVGRNMNVQSEAVENDPYLAFDVAAGKLAKQLRRHKRRLRDHRDHGDNDNVVNVRALILSDDSIDQSEDAAADIGTGEEPAIVAEMTTPILTLSVSEAVMHMDLSGQPALLFRNARDQSINMVYRRTDGNIGWVDAGTATQGAASEAVRRQASG